MGKDKSKQIMIEIFLIFIIYSRNEKIIWSLVIIWVAL